MPTRDEHSRHSAPEKVFSDMTEAMLDAVYVDASGDLKILRSTFAKVWSFGLDKNGVEPRLLGRRLLNAMAAA